MGVTNYNKELSATEISCDESFNIRLSLTAEPDITANPVDIALILDRSGMYVRQRDYQPEKRGKSVCRHYL